MPSSSSATAKEGRVYPRASATSPRITTPAAAIEKPRVDPEPRADGNPPKDTLGIGAATARRSGGAAQFVKAPLIAECHAHLECKVIDRKLVPRYNFFVLEVVKAWIESRRKPLRTMHHQGEGVFLVAGRTIKLPSPITSRLTK